MRLTIGKKLITSYLGLSLFVLLAGVVGIVELNKVADSTNTIAREKAPTQYVVMNAAVSLSNVQKLLERYIKLESGLDALEEQINQGLAEFDMWISMLHLGTESQKFQKSQAGALYSRKGLTISLSKSSGELLDLVKSLIGDLVVLRSHTDDLVQTQRTFNSYLVEAGGTTHHLPALLNLAQRDHLEWVKQLKDAVNIETIFTGNTDHTKGTMGEWLTQNQVEDTEFAELMQKAAKQHKKLCDLAIKINKEPEYKKKNKLLRRGIGATAKIEKYFSLMHVRGGALYQELSESKEMRLAELNATATSINQHLNTLISRANSEMKAARHDSENNKKSAQTFLLGITATAMIIAAVFGFFISQAISKPILHSVNGLISGADMVSNSAASVSSASQTLAEGASESAAAIEQTTASTEEMAAMTRQNATNADQADNLMKNALDVIGAAEKSMQEMLTSMEEISEASEETSKIVKTIDEIAFQTNLLALNAAVEAARAGEAGAGFAVVADEVRNLAMRAAKAAKETEGLLESTSHKVLNGKDIVQRANGAFKEVADNSHTVGSLVGEIATASKEQAQGFEQISKAILQMDTITQQNSASSEESAAASEELNTQAATMLVMIDRLQKLVDGSTSASSEQGSFQAGPVEKSSLPLSQTSKQPTDSSMNMSRKPSSPKSVAEIPEKIIPLDAEESFEDF